MINFVLQQLVIICVIKSRRNR